MGMHTPGPWSTKPRIFSVDNHDILAGDDEWIAKVFHVSDGEGKANARLIAAAPEMLDDLKACVSVLRGHGDHQIADMIEKTIAKAERG